MAHSNRETQVLDEVFRKELIEKLDELRKSNLLCDTTLRADGQEFAAHRSVLSVGSQYFRTLFATQLNVQETEKKNRRSQRSNLSSLDGGASVYLHRKSKTQLI